MGLESTTFISGLASSNPVSSDPKSQGDDHLRLIKSALQSTFPAASTSFVFPRAVNYSTGELSVILATHQNMMFCFDTASDDAGLTLPTLTGMDGWYCDVIKVSSDDDNSVGVWPASGQILTQSGAVESVRIGSLASPVRFIWTQDGYWVCVRSGPIIGSTTEAVMDTPLGYLELNGDAFDPEYYAELSSILGGVSTLPTVAGKLIRVS